MKVALDKIEVGFELEPITKVMDRAGMLGGEKLSAGNIVHSDDEFSKREGLPAAIAVGMTSTMYLNQLLTDFFGEDWVKGGGSLSNKYIAPVFLGDTLTCHAQVSEKVKEKSGYRLALNVWCEKAGGQKTTVGNASVVVR